MARIRSRITVRRTVTVRQTVMVRRTVQALHQLQPQQHIVNPQPRTIGSSTRSQLRPSVASFVDAGFGPIDDPDREFDLFLCYASENREFVEPLATELEARGVRVWYDATAISVGDSLRESIDRGLARSRFGVVILSREFFAKRWTNYELNGLVTREMQGRKVVLPVWHPSLTFEELVKFSPPLADKKALVAGDLLLSEIAARLAELVQP